LGTGGLERPNKSHHSLYARKREITTKNGREWALKHKKQIGMGVC